MLLVVRLVAWCVRSGYYLFAKHASCGTTMLQCLRILSYGSVSWSDGEEGQQSVHWPNLNNYAIIAALLAFVGDFGKTAIKGIGRSPMRESSKGEKRNDRVLTGGPVRLRARRYYEGLVNRSMDYKPINAQVVDLTVTLTAQNTKSAAFPC
jgi:hypothetical protein